MKDGSKETLDRVSPIFMSTNKNNSSMAIYLRTYGAGWFTFLFRGSSPGKRGQQILFGIPTFSGPRAKMSNSFLPLRGSQSNHFIFQMKRPDTNSGPLLPIVLHSKAETRYVHGMGAFRRNTVNTHLYSRSRKNLARQLLHHSYKSASATP